MSLHLEPLPTETGRGPWPKLLDPAVAGVSGLSQKLSPFARRGRPPRALYADLTALQHSLALQVTGLVVSDRVCGCYTFVMW